MGIIRHNRERSPIFNGQIEGVGPRYCPSIEDKAFRYQEKDIHHVFIEPEGLNLETIYPNGCSTSLPLDVQLDFIHTIKGLERAEILIPGYAVEYDVVDTTELDLTLQHKSIAGLYFAGQVNGTSGYEEAAGQGLVAGINAALSVLHRDPMILSREESYIGVMVEDLVTNLRDEPYRLFTARSENRLYVREDNTFLRMAPYRKNLALVSTHDALLDTLVEEYSILKEIIHKIQFFKTNASDVIHFQEKNYGPLETNITLNELLKRPNIDPISTLTFEIQNRGLHFHEFAVRTVAIGSKYDGYIHRSGQELERLEKLNHKKIFWEKVIQSNNVSFECRQRIEKIQPSTFGQLSRIEGIRPATLSYVANNFL